MYIHSKFRSIFHMFREQKELEYNRRLCLLIKDVVWGKGEGLGLSIAYRNVVGSDKNVNVMLQSARAARYAAGVVKCCWSDRIDNAIKVKALPDNKMNIHHTQCVCVGAGDGVGSEASYSACGIYIGTRELEWFLVCHSEGGEYVFCLHRNTDVIWRKLYGICLWGYGSGLSGHHWFVSMDILHYLLLYLVNFLELNGSGTFLRLQRSHFH